VGDGDAALRDEDGAADVGAADVGAAVVGAAALGVGASAEGAPGFAQAAVPPTMAATSRATPILRQVMPLPTSVGVVGRC
jgi:hypothetical protein